MFRKLRENPAPLACNVGREQTPAILSVPLLSWVARSVESGAHVIGTLASSGAASGPRDLPPTNGRALSEQGGSHAVR